MPGATGRPQTEALRAALAVHRGEAPDPPSVLNAKAIDPVTLERPVPSRVISKRGGATPISEPASPASASASTRNLALVCVWTIASMLMVTCRGTRYRAAHVVHGNSTRRPQCYHAGKRGTAAISCFVYG